MAGVLVTFGLLCSSFYLVVHQVDGAREVEPKSYAVKERRTRMKRDYYSRDYGCKENKIIDNDNGFSSLSKENLTVKFITDNEKHSMHVSWKTPKGKNNSLLVGYWFRWLVFRDGDSSFVCQFLSAENTSYVVHESPHWKKDEVILISVRPLPTIRSNKTYYIPYTPRYNDSHQKQRVNTSSASTTSATIITSTTNTGMPSHSSSKIVMSLASANKQSKEKKIFTITIVAIASATAMSLVGFILVLRFCKPKRPPRPVIEREPGYIYVSHISESESHTDKVVEFSSWFRKQGYDVQMDIMLTPSKQLDLKELGRLRWGEKQLLKAKNVFIILSPSYLNLCRLDEGKTDATNLTQEETIVYSEITQIRNELSSTAYISSRFIPVLFGVKETELPFWIKQLVVYNWPEDKWNNKLLYRINEEVAYENNEVTDTSQDCNA